MSVDGCVLPKCTFKKKDSLVSCNPWGSGQATGVVTTLTPALSLSEIWKLCGKASLGIVNLEKPCTKLQCQCRSTSSVKSLSSVNCRIFKKTLEYHHGNFCVEKHPTLYKTWWMATPVAWFELHELNDTGFSFFQKCILERHNRPLSLALRVRGASPSPGEERKTVLKFKKDSFLSEEKTWSCL